MKSVLREQTKLFTVAALCVAFLYRLAFGLSSDLWTNVDNKQIYLLGLKFYTTGLWPYFGPDVTPTIQIPGALQGLLVGLPFFLLPIPEAPYILLSVLSFASLSFFAWYCTRRLPQLPKWLIWAWVMTLPWTLNVSTSIYNPSYVLTGGVLFFIGTFEVLPFTGKGLIPNYLANASMGFGLAWTMQLHLSWVILVPFVFFSLYMQSRTLGKRIYVQLLCFAMAAAIPATVLIPTYLKYGFVSGMGSTGETVSLNTANIVRSLNPVEGIPARFLSFASYEIQRFMDVPGDFASHTARRLAFLQANKWLIPFALILLVTGILQPLFLALGYFSRLNLPDWKAIKYITLATLLLLYVSFLFSSKSPAAHTFYVTLPVVLLYALYCVSKFLTRPGWIRLATFLISCSIIFHAGLAIDHFSRTSLYIDRARIVEAIKTRNYHLVGERPSGARY